MRDMRADWKRWSRGERVTAIAAGFMMAAAIPLTVLMAVA
jgi:hypothetical protein